MARSARHREKAERNLAFVNSMIGKPDFPEWKAVAAFYTAVHLIERLRSSFSEHSQNHEERFAFFRKRPQPFSAIYPICRILYDASILARYQTKNQFDRAFPDMIVETVLIGTHLNRINSFVDNHFTP